MKKSKQRRIGKRKKKKNNFVSVLTHNLISGFISALMKEAATFPITFYVKEEKEPEDDDELQYCGNCKTYYKGQCDCRAKQLPPST